MILRSIKPVLIGALLLGALLCACEQEPQPMPVVPVLTAKPCEYFARIAGQSMSCYWYATDPDGGFRLPVAVLSKTDTAPAPALVYIPGGPGDGMQTAAESLEYWSYWYADSPITADLVIFNPRALLGSQPYWGCPEYDLNSFALMQQDISYAEEAKASTEVLARCLEAFDRWLRQDRKLEGIGTLSTTHQARDVLGIVAALGYREWHVWGVSYGTRVALKVAELATVNTDKATRPASLILDSVYPYTAGRQSEWAVLQEKALALHSQYFKERFPGRPFMPLWQAANAQLTTWCRGQAGACLFTAENWNVKRSEPDYYRGKPAYATLYSAAAQPFRFYLNPERLLALMFFVLYDENLLTPFYQSLIAIQQQSLQWQVPMLQVITPFVNQSFAPSFNSLAFYATECSDNARESEEDYQRVVSQYPRWASYLQTMREFDVCRLSIFHSPGIGLREIDPFDTLIFSGARDHVTPPYWAEQLTVRLLKQGTRVTLINVPGLGHSVVNAGRCKTQLLHDWLRHHQTGAFSVEDYCGKGE